MAAIGTGAQAKRAARKQHEAFRRTVTTAFALRHPARAAEERRLRQRSAEIDRDFNKANFIGTPETLAKARQVRQGSLARLYQSGAIDGEQLAAAAEIAGVVERIGADVAVRTVSLETRVDQSRRGDGLFYEHLGAVRREVAYGAWRAALGGSARPVLEMICEDAGLVDTARRWRISDRRMRQLLISALDLWGEHREAAGRDVDEGTLLAARAFFEFR